MEENAVKEDEVFGEVIYAYTRKQAIEDGVLVDVTQTAEEAGFRYPFAVTEAVWSLIEQVPKRYRHEDIGGRLWDVLMVAKASIRGLSDKRDVVFFDVILHHEEGSRVRFKLHCVPGDSGEPALTLMLPHED